MREVAPEPYKKAEQEAKSTYSVVLLISLGVVVALGFFWNNHRQKEIKEKALYYYANGVQRPRLSWANLQIGQSQEVVESLLGAPTMKYPTCWYYTATRKDYVDYDSADPQVYFDIDLKVRGWVLPR